MTALAFEDVHVRLGHERVLEGLSFAIPPGELAVLIGPNGVGKSTLMRCAAGMLCPDRGSVRVAGLDVARDPVAAKRHLGYAIEPARLPPELTGRQCIELFARARGIEPVIPALAAALGFLPWLDTEVAFCSLGTRQKLGLLLALIGEPPLLLLDEVTNGLDPASAFALKQHLVERSRAGVAILLATHAIDVAERLADRVLLLGGGRIARTWTPDELAAKRAAPGFSLEPELVAAMPGPR